MPATFKLYAKYYDLLYKEKDYRGEADYVEGIIKKFAKGANKVLNLGSGTGKHDIEFAKRGYDVTAVEISPTMVKIAKENLKKSNNGLKIKFYRGDIRELKLDTKFDVVISLFHVMSYQVTNDDIRNTLSSVKRHLKRNGIFIFDFWYGPAVLKERPESRIKRIEDREMKIERRAEPVLKINENKVEVNYRVMFKQKKTGASESVLETHNMRYFFLPEINMFLEDAGLNILYYSEWLTNRDLTDNSWSAAAVARYNPK